MNTKPPKFFCEHCGNEVKRSTKVCPYCGSFFVNVRCPVCGFVGNERSFVAGCPNCGYAFKQGADSAVPSESPPPCQSGAKTADSEKLPAWVYVLVGLLCAGVIVLGLFIYR